MSSIAGRFSIISILVLMHFGSAAQGQSRIAMPTMLPGETSTGAWTAASPSTASYAPNGVTASPGMTSSGLIPAPNMSAAAAPTTPYATPATTAVSPASPNPQLYAPPGNSFGPAGSVSPFNATATAPPAGSYYNTLPPPSPGLDPYATPGTSTAPLFPQDPYFNAGAPAIPMASMTKFLQNIRLDYHWFLGHGPQELGINDFDVSATFAIPFLDNPNTPLLVTPGFGLQLWEGPISVAPVLPTDPPAADLPSKTYDGYIDTAWKPQISQSFGGDLSFRVGAYTDFTTFTTHSFRYTGTALGVITLSPSFKLKAGIMYLDRLQTKLLPSGGIVWTPNPEWEFNILFPNPKIRMHWMNFGSVDWWMYVAGDYGGGSWTIKRADIDAIDPVVRGQNDAFDYDDIRVSAGLEFLTPRRFNGWFEVGGAFSRKIHYRNGFPDDFFPNNTVFLRAGMAY